VKTAAANLRKTSFSLFSGVPWFLRLQMV